VLSRSFAVARRSFERQLAGSRISVVRATLPAKLLLLLTLTTPLVVSANVEPANATFPGQNGLIAFSTPQLNDAPGIISIEPSGLGRRRLTHRFDSSPVPSPDGTRIAFVRGIGRSLYVHVMRSNGSGVRRVALGRSPSWSPDGRKLAFDSADYETGNTVSIVNVDGSGLRRVGPGYGPSWSPDGAHIAFRSNGPGLVVWSTEDATETTIEVARCCSASPEWSPDGRRLAFVTYGGEPYVANADGTDTSLLVTRSDAFFWTPAWSPSGREIAFTGISPGATPRVVLVDVQTGVTRRLARDAHDPAWSPDARRLAFLRGWSPSRLFVVPATGGPARQVSRERRGSGVTTAMWGSDGRLVYALSPGSDGELMTVRPNGTDLRQLTDDFEDDIQPAWSPDGRRIAFARETRSGAEIYVMNAEGTARRRLTQNASDDREPAWSPDGRKIAFARGFSGRDPELAVMNSDGTGLRTLVPRGWSPTWSPDGQWIAFVGWQELAVIRADGTDRRVLAQGEISSPDWSPDGQWIAYTVHAPSSGPGVHWLEAVRPDGSGEGTLFGRERTLQLLNAGFSPDGRGAVAMVATSGPLVVISLGGERLESIPRPIFAWDPAWQPLPYR